MQNSILKRIVSLEYLVVAILIALFYIVVGEFAWYWLPVLFLVFDISAVGYLINAKFGAFLYNVGHSLIGPSLLAIIYIGTTNQFILFVTLVWLFHIFVDRALGYGLKHSTSFNHTHLGPIGKARQK
ncbi:MAG: DUF4260 domain-containing protein [Candidatus Saccharibacteria bacterium]